MKNYKIVNYDSSFINNEVCVRFPITGKLKNKIPFFYKTFPRKNFFKELKHFLKA